MDGACGVVGDFTALPFAETSAEMKTRVTTGFGNAEIPGDVDNISGVEGLKLHWTGLRSQWEGRE